VSSESGQRKDSVNVTQGPRESRRAAISDYAQCCAVSSDLDRLFGSFQCSKRCRTRAMHGGWQGSPRRHGRRRPVSHWEPWAQGWGSNAGSQCPNHFLMSPGPPCPASEKPRPPRSAILKRSSHPFPREVLVIHGREAKAPCACLTDRHRKAQAARIRGQTGRWRWPGRVKEKKEEKWYIFLQFHWLEASSKLVVPISFFSTPRERVIGPPRPWSRRAVRYALGHFGVSISPH
jgi:hypothetical protein